VIDSEEKGIFKEIPEFVGLPGVRIRKLESVCGNFLFIPGPVPERSREDGVVLNFVIRRLLTHPIEKSFGGLARFRRE
jgi:hypothetical protein